MENPVIVESRTGRVAPWPIRGWTGLLLVGVFWPLNWFLPSVRTAYLFFPLWLGLILILDATVYRRTGDSIWTRSKRGFVLLFVVSAPAWWLFELINRRTQNWEYLGAGSFSDLEYVVLCTVSFSTVMPAVFEAAEWVRSWKWVDRLQYRRRIPATRKVCGGFLITGLLMLALVWLWPRAFYPLVWASLVLLLEPVNAWLGRPALLRHLARGDWRPPLSLALGALICGFFWEMWNYYSFPKWIYHTPGAQFLHVFEMPLLGFLGYLPFAWELYALRHLVWPTSDAPSLEPRDSAMAC